MIRMLQNPFLFLTLLSCYFQGHPRSLCSSWFHSACIRNRAVLMSRVGLSGFSLGGLLVWCVVEGREAERPMIARLSQGMRRTAATTATTGIGEGELRMPFARATVCWKWAGNLAQRHMITITLDERFQHVRDPQLCLGCIHLSQ